MHALGGECNRLERRSWRCVVVGSLAVRSAGAIIAISCLQDVIVAQTTTTSQPAFEVASVRQNKSGSLGMGMQFLPGGRFTATNVSLSILIESAYNLKEGQLEGGPAWIHDDQFDVIAKADVDLPRPSSDAAPGLFHFMLRALLADRFKLSVHYKIKQMPIYELRRARDDG